MPIIYESNYYNALSRYFKDEKYDEVLNNPNFTAPFGIKNSVKKNLLHESPETKFTTMISFIASTKNGIIKPVIDSIGLLGDKILYVLIKCSECKIDDHVFTNMTLYELRLIMTLICSHKVEYNTELESIISHFPEAFFSDIYSSDFGNNDNRDRFKSLKHTKFISNSDPIFSNYRDDVLFLDDLSILDNSIAYATLKTFHEYTPKMYNITIRLVIDNDYKIMNLMSDTSARFIFDYMTNDKNRIAIILTCDLSTLHELCKLWILEIKSSPTIAFMYYCLMEYKHIYNYIKLPADDEKSLLNFLVNDNARNR